jgi:hypothetical protein
MEGMLDCIVSWSFFSGIETSCFISTTFKRLENLWYCSTRENISHELSFTGKLVVEIAELEKRVALLVKLKDRTVFWDSSGKV